MRLNEAIRLDLDRTDDMSSRDRDQVVTPGAVSARWVRSTSSQYSPQPSAATSAISPWR
jgi:hypothetical protein